MKLKLVSFWGWLLVGLLCRSLRYRIHDPEGWLAGPRRTARKIWACWHGQQLIGFYFFRRRGTGILSSLSRDGDYSSSILRRFGWRIFRGSSRRGGARGLLELLRFLRAGGEIALTPDGPRGPAYHIEPGILYLAGKTDSPIIPFAIAARPAWYAASWDRFLVPWPFARCAVYFGEPFRVKEEELTAEKMPFLQASLATAIHRANQGAAEMLVAWKRKRPAHGGSSAG
ncbi:MAG: lysophospholipid acyltransferase family protein [Firmicutes bacterium]|nr:lysophospholipid acyltransferase family protein [Bacillota bacterium]